MRGGSLGLVIVEVSENNRIQVNRIGQLLTDQSQNIGKQHIEIHQTASDEFQYLLSPAEKLLANLSYSHLQELASITNLTKRTFLEIEAINNTWSVKELKRQINTLYYEQSGLQKPCNQTILFLVLYNQDCFSIVFFEIR